MFGGTSWHRPPAHHRILLTLVGLLPWVLSAVVAHHSAMRTSITLVVVAALYLFAPLPSHKGTVV
jgi:hypothetical protein